MTGTATLDAAPASDACAGGLIDSVRHPAVARVADVLRSRSTRPRTVLIDDGENIAQAIRAGVRVVAVYATASELGGASWLREQAPGIELHVLTDDVMRSLFARERHTRVFALAHAPKPASWRDIAASGGDVVVLDGVRIAGNIGAIIRSVRAFGGGGVVLLNSGIDTVYDRRLIRASRGLLFTVPVLLATRTELEAFLRSERMPLASMTADASRPLRMIARARGRIAILMGSERSGVSGVLDALADQHYAVPMMPGVDSLNVSVAAAIALYERQRGSMGT